MITVLEILTFKISIIFLWKFNLWKPHARHRVNNERAFIKIETIHGSYENQPYLEMNSKIFESFGVLAIIIWQPLHVEVPKRGYRQPCMVQNNTGACEIDLINRDKIFPSNHVKEYKLSINDHTTWDVNVSNEKYFLEQTL